MEVMEVLPSGDLRIVFAGPARLVETSLKKWLNLDGAAVQEPALAMVKRVGGRIREKEEDECAQGMFDLAGTTATLFPLERVVVLEMPSDAIEAAIAEDALRFVGGHSPFSSFKVAENIVRIFANGYATVALSIDFGCGKTTSAKYIAYLRRAFAYDASEFGRLRDAVLSALRAQALQISTELLSDALPRKCRLVGEVPFLSTVYIFSGRWAEPKGRHIQLHEDLRIMIQPEAGEPLLSQSTSSRELIIYTSGFHIYIHNRNHGEMSDERRTTLICFLNLMNVLYDQLEYIKNVVKEKLKQRTRFYVPTDIDERLEILYNQVMVASTWRRDIRSFTAQISRRWMLPELKEYCLALIAALEARSASKRKRYFTYFLAIVTLAQLVSVAEDWDQLARQHRLWWNPVNLLDSIGG